MNLTMLINIIVIHQQILRLNTIIQPDGLINITQHVYSHNVSANSRTMIIRQ